MIDPAAGRFQGQSARISIPATTSLPLPSKGIVTVTVVRLGPGSSLLLRFGDLQFKATTSMPLRAGESYRVRIDRSGRGVQLKLIGQMPRAVGIEEIVNREGLPPGPVTEAVVRAFLRSGLPLNPQEILRSLRRTESAAKERPGKMNEIARMNALAERKGLSFPEEALIGLLGPGGEDSGDASQRRPAQHNKRRKPGRDEVKKAFEPGEHADHPLQLFNHVIGEGDHWVIIPVGLPGGEIRASLRIRIPRGAALGNSPASAFREAMLSVVDHAGEWLFGLRPSRSGVHAELVSVPGSEDAEAVITQVRELLPEISVASFAGDRSDGFSLPEAADIMTSVDSSA